MENLLEIKDQIDEVAHAYSIAHSNLKFSPITKGLIHQTFKLQSEEKAFILQIINTDVFKNPAELMRNIGIVAHHLEKVDYPKTILKPIQTTSKEYIHKNRNSYWRCFPFIENTMTLDTADSQDTTHQIAFTFGEYLRYLQHLPVAKLSTTIPGFHDTPGRYDQLKTVYDISRGERKKSALKTLQQLESKKYLLKYYVPINKMIRVTHGDTKVNNILLDKETNKPVCVIDLDTLMPGMISFDYGDMIRTMAATVSEDHPHISEVAIRKEYVEALYDGFLSALGSAISQDERETLEKGAALIIYEQAIRFLSDFLTNDQYYAVQYHNQNLVRGQNQLALLEAYLDVLG